MKPVEISGGVPNYRTDLSRYRADVYHIAETCGEILLLKKRFPIVDTCLSCKDIVRQSCAMVPVWQILDNFLRPVFSASRVQHVSDLI